MAGNKSADETPVTETVDTSPIDAEFEPADATPPRQPDASSVSLPVALALSAAAAVLGGLFGVAFDGDTAAPRDDTALTARLESIESELTELAGAVGSTDDGGAAAAISNTQAGLRQLNENLGDALGRLAVLENAGVSGSDPEAAARLSQRIDTLATDAANALRSAEAASHLVRGQQASLEAMRLQVDNMTAELRDQRDAVARIGDTAAALTRRLTGVQAAPRSNGAGAAAALAFAELAEAATTGRSFVTELDDARPHFPNNVHLDAIAAVAETGAPTELELARAFRPAAIAARQAGRSQGGGIAHRVGQAVTSIVTVRRLDAPASDAAGDIVARAQSRLAENDLTGAVAEMERLRGEAAEATANWLAMARGRLDLEQHLGVLRESLATG